MALHKERKNRINDNRHRNAKFIYFFDVDKCKVCPLRDGCYKPGAKSRTYHVTIKTDEQIEQLKERIYEREAAVSEEETEKVEEAVEQAGETAETVETETAKEAAKEVEAIESGNEDMNE